jgi:hypothetical protein
MDMDFSAFKLATGFADGEPLAAVDWSGLVARLAAERDLRRELTARIGAAASFTTGAAAVLESACEGPVDGEPAVNPAALAVGKAHGGIRSDDGANAPAAGNEARGQE